MNTDAPIGVFDSGLGGLTVVRELRRVLPNEKIIYFGDIARLPYGIKSQRQIRDFSVENTEFLLSQKIKALVIACNSSSSAAYQYLKRRYSISIIDVIEPVAKQAVQQTKNGRVGILATQATIASQAYVKAIRRYNSHVQVFSQACPLLVTLVEEGILKGEMTRMALDRYLAPLLKKRIDTLILGCTHYPLLHDVIQKKAGKRVRLIDSAPATVAQLKLQLGKWQAFRNGRSKGSLQVYLSDQPIQFKKVGSRFLGERLKQIRIVRHSHHGRNGKWVR